MSGKSTDNVFVPQVANDHINAHFDRKMGLGQLAVMDKTLEGAPGDTVTFPYFKKMNDAEEPDESTGLTVDKLIDDKFQVTVKEIGKAAGWSDKQRRKSGAGNGIKGAGGRFRDEAFSQIGQLFAEKVDKDIVTCVNANGSYKTGFTATTAADVLNVGSLLDLKIGAFGDKQDQAVAVAMHSLSFATLMKDAGTGFLKADATQPLFGAPGYQGLLLGQAVFVLDSCPRVEDVGGKKAYAALTFKPNAFGIFMAEEMNPEEDRDILMREGIVAATMWYGVLSLHGQVAADDLRIGRGTFATLVSA